MGNSMRCESTQTREELRPLFRSPCERARLHSARGGVPRLQHGRRLPVRLPDRSAALSAANGRPGVSPGYPRTHTRSHTHIYWGGGLHRLRVAQRQGRELMHRDQGTQRSQMGQH